jgi:hypothetical protein
MMTRLVPPAYEGSVELLLIPRQESPKLFGKESQGTGGHEKLEQGLNRAEWRKAENACSVRVASAKNSSRRS